MSQHLPECDTFRFAYGDGYGGCICEWLRACERRVREDERQKIRSAHLTGIQVVEVNKAYVSGYNRALDAAREAVAALVRYDHNNYALVLHPDGWAIDRDEAFAAIDTLREETK